MPTSRRSCRPALIAKGRTLIASEAGLPDTLVNADKNNFSPRVGFAWRLDESNKTVLRGGFGLFHPTVAVQGIRDLLATNEFRYSNTFRGGGLSNGFTGGTPSTRCRRLRQRRHQSEPSEPGHLPVQHHRRARDAGRHGPPRQLHRLDDAEAAGRSRFQHAAGEHGAVRSRRIPRTTRGCRSRSTATSWTSCDNRGEGQFNALQIEASRRYKSGFALNAAYTLAHSDSNAPDTGNSRSVRSSSIRTTSRRTAARSQRVDAPLRGERDVGRSRRPRSEARRQHGGVVGRAVRRMDGLGALPGAQRPAPDAVLQRLLHDEPLEHRQAARRPWHVLLLRVAAGSDQGSECRRPARCVLRSDRVRHSG